MKKPAIFVIAFLLLLTQGCTSNDRNSAGREGGTATSATAAPASGSAAPISQNSDPAANGGSSLTASAPYSQPSGATAQQNVNPAPFMIAGRGQGAAPGTAPSRSLTSRADGTMIGPNDQPPATTGWGTAPTSYASPSTAAKPSAQQAKPAPPK